ncbi:vascular cell adhesion protein 1 isoform X2 [Eleutherodactylus coqui]|uniref:vascular cell adhesion protein 1 isoform X2 n=1 Tax=Eleutherodactylus coqui TaxID=57060 RepID=UPI00346214E7
MGKTRTLTPTLLRLLFSITFMQTSALDFSLSSPQTTIEAQIGEELRITCFASKCSDKNPSFTWSTLMDKILGGNVISVGQTSTLTMTVDAESEGSYRCTVSCDNPPGERRFKILVYSFPSDPTLHISSLVVGQQSRITCIIPSIYPYEMLSADIKLNEEIVAEFDSTESTLNSYEIQNISLTHDLILTEDVKTIKCEAILPFPDTDIEPIKRQAELNLTLMYPPAKPEITVRPSPMVKAGEDIQLSCSSDSRSQTVVQWLRLMGDVELQMPSNYQGSLTIIHTKPEDSGVYICYVKNEAGITSLQVEINVQDLPEKPTLSLKPGTRVVAGQAVTIECLVSDGTNFILRKISEDGDVFLAPTGKVIIKEADPIDTAVYKCIAENQYGVSETSKSLTVEYPPRETILSSSSIDLNEGDTVTMTCVSKGVPAPTISIYQLLTSGESVLLSQDPEITLANVTSGIYQCQATNRLGSEKDKLELMVRVPPSNTSITIMPSHTVKEGDSVHIRCISESFPDPNLVLRMKTELGINELESEHGQYSISHATVEHTGTYICESSNVVGQQIAEAILTVQAPPQNTLISITPSSVVREGDSVQVRCTSEASPAPTLALKMKMEDDVVDLVSDGGEYNIVHAEVRHTGDEIVETTLHVEVPPRNTYLVINPSAVVKEGDSVQIWCSSEGSPEPSLVLKFRIEDEFISLESSDGFYNITHVGMKNAGMYMCESTNEVGQQVVEGKLTVQKPQQQSPSFNPTPMFIFGSAAFVTAGIIGSVIYHLKKSKLKGSYSLVKALRSKV